MSDWKPYVFIWLVLGVPACIIGSLSPLFILNENQILYYFSASAQVIAAIYGLTITGYTFLRNELDRRASDDESYEEIISYLKRDYHAAVLNISVASFFSIVFCLSVIFFEKIDHLVLVSIVINLSSSSVLVVLFMVSSFVVTILNPNSFEEISKRIKKETKVASDGEKGSLEDFLKVYNEIEYLLEKYGTAFSTSLQQVPWPQDPGKYRKAISKVKLVQILFQAEKISVSLRDRLVNLVSFRNALIHGSELYISKGDLNEVNQIRDALNEALNAR